MQKQRSTPLSIASPCLRANKFSPLPVVAVPTHLIPHGTAAGLPSPEIYRFTAIKDPKSTGHTRDPLHRI
jgi:hypothetical protein